MAVTAPLITRQRIMAAKQESTDGTAVALTNSDAGFNIYDPSFTPEFEIVERPGQSSLDALPSVTGGQRMNVSFSTLVHGKGATGPPAWGLFLQACSFSLSASTYTVETGSSSYVSTTMGLYEDGRLRTAVGCVGTVEITFTAGQPARANWTFLGKFADGSTTALLLPNYPTVVPPRFANTNALKIASTKYRASSVTLTVNNEMMLRQDPDDTTGFRSAAITNRRVMWTIDPEAATAKDFYADFKNAGSTEVDITVILGTAANNIITFNSPKCQIVGATPTDRDGILADTLEFQASRSASEGDDALTIAFT